MPRLSRSGISTVIGMALFVLIAIALLATIYIVFNEMLNALNKVANLATYRVSELQLANSINGWWVLQGSTLIINVTNNAPISIEITSIAIVLSNGSYVALYKGHTDSATVTIVYPSGVVTSQALSLPLTLGTGYSANISIPGIITATPKSISLAVTASPLVISIPLKPYTPTAAKPSPPPIYLLKLAHYAGLGTVAITKKANAAAYATINGSITSLSVNAQTYIGTAPDIQALDNTYLNATSIKVPPDIYLTNRNAILYTNFTSNPFTQPQTSPMYLYNYSSTTTGIWSWGSYGYIDGGIEYSDSLTASSLLWGLFVTNDASLGLAYNNYTSFTTISATSNWSIYVKVYVPSLSSTNFTTSGSLSYDFWYIVGTAYVENTTNYYILGILAYYSSSSTSTSYYLAVVNSTSTNGISIYAISNALTLTPGWYILVTEYSPTLHATELFLYSINGTLLARANYVDNSAVKPNPQYVGLGTFYYLYIASATSFTARVSITPASKFDDFIAGIGNVTIVTVSNLPNGYIVTLFNSTGGIVNSSTANNGIATLNVITQPIVSSATIDINDSLGNLVLSKQLDLVLGGDSYTYLPPRYEVSLNISSFIDLQGVINDTSYWTLSLGVSLVTNNTYVNVSILALDISSGQLKLVSTVNNVVSLTSSYTLSPPTTYLNTTTGIVNATLEVYSAYPFNVSINLFNAKLRALKLGTETPLLIVGVGESSLIDVYQISTYASGPALTYLYSIDAHTIFNGSASLAYSPVDHKLYLLNTSGIFYAYIMPSANFSALITNALCRATGAGAQIAAINVSGYPFIIVFPGAGNNTLCIINASSGTVSTLSVPPAYSYTVAAYNDTCAWFVANYSGTPELLQLCASNLASVTPLLNLSTLKNVGLAYCPGLNELDLLAEGGPSYVINLVTKTVSRSLNPPFYPVGVGDRLGCYNGYAFFVRADDTNELWSWRIG